MTSHRKLPIVLLSLLSGCAGGRSGQSQGQPLTDCKNLPPPISFEQRIAVKKAVLIGRDELQVLLDTKGCRSRRVELCWSTGEILTSGTPQVEFLAVGSTEQKACTEHVTEDVRVFDAGFVNRAFHDTLQHCRADHGRVYCVIELNW